MGRKKVVLINIDNYDIFIHYIRARTKKLTDGLVSQLIEQINTDKKKCNHLESEYELKYNVEVHKPEKLSQEHIKSIAKINEIAFHDSNCLIESIEGLKRSFKNAQSQARYKKKNKLTDNERFSLDFNIDEYIYLKMIKDLCKKNNIKLEHKLKVLHSALSKIK